MSATQAQQVRCVVDGEVVGEVERTPSSALPDLVARAVDGQRAWWRAAAHHRGDALTAAADAITAVAAPLAELYAAESGKPLGQARHEVAGAAAQLRGLAHLTAHRGGEVAPTGATPRAARDLTVVQRVPLGVVACVVPFNFPVELTVEKAGSAIAAGNAAIVKAPPQNPLATRWICDLLAEHLPPGLVQCVVGGTDVSAALCAMPGVDAVSLTGSVGAGRAVAVAAAPLLRPVHLELGGNAAAIVLDGADLDLVTREVVAGRLLMNGQACAATKRVVVVGADRAREVVDRLDVALRDVVVGDARQLDTQVGPLIDQVGVERVAGQVARAVDQGARVAHGTGRADGPFVAPTVLADVPADADVAVDDEIFGPVFAVVTVADDEEAVAVTDRSALRLTAAVFDADWSRALTVAERLDVGGVVVNGSTNYRPPEVPFGGVADAGLGREGLGWTLDELSRTRFVALKSVRPAPVAW